MSQSGGGLGKSRFDNVGHVSCYINCALQSLMHMDEAMQSIFQAPDTKKDSMYHAIRLLYEAYWESNGIIRPMGLIMHLDKCGFSREIQGDSTEVLTFILQKLHEDICVPFASAEAAETETMKKQAKKEWEADLGLKGSKVVDLFWGQYRNKKQCGDCFTSAYKYETFHYLTLPVVEEQEANIMAPIGLHTLFERLRQQKRFDESNKFFCEKCQTKVERATDDTLVWKVPTYLVIQLNRYHGSTHKIKKCTRVITYPTMFDPCLLQQEKQHKEQEHKEPPPQVYLLQSGVLHHGQTFGGGHYTYFGWNKHSGEWLHFDDGAKPVKLQGPVLAHPGIYQLIYKLINT
jgi:ubiquitin carboxyl-terminal hydrolase 8